MRTAIRESILFFFLIFLAAATHAQQPGYKYFKLEKDNKAVKINTLFKTSQGYIYTGTDNGVYRFDGERYTRINFDNPDYTDTATALFEDRGKRIWVGFRSGRIAHIINKRLVYYNPEEGTPKKKITAFLQDRENNIWFASNGEGIYYIKDRHIYLVNEENGLSDLNISSMLLTDNGDVLAGSDQGINLCSLRNGNVVVSVIGPRNGLPDYIVTSISPAGNNTYWIGLQDKGFCLYNHNNKTITVPPASQNWKYGQVNSLLQSHDMLWIGTNDQGLFKYEWQNRVLDTLAGAGAGLTIQDLLRDKQGNIWMASSQHGLVRTNGGVLKLVPIPGSPVFEHVHAILSAGNGDTWASGAIETSDGS
ncbi:MAG TPA: two-component regulator propeller domain-containing protein, partial [Ferruginibacter sp.]|nr:two-component regulator propeller domain-containing protein [Ferruginibacter sp.]